LAILKKAEAGASVQEVCPWHGVSPATYYQTYYQWKS
jgi:hypothetical protein